MITFEDAYWFMWLARSLEPYRHLSFTANQFRESIEAAWAAGNIAIIPNLINGINQISRGSTDPIERAEIQLVCARIYFELGDYVNSLTQLDAAYRSYVSDTHNQAVVSWMKGYVLWAKLGNIAEALELWQHSLETFEMLAKSQQVLRQGADWYQDWCEEMSDSIAAVI